MDFVHITASANIAGPLHWLTQKETEFVWTVQCNKAFPKLKQLLTAAPILAYPIALGRYTLDTDTSESNVIRSMTKSTKPVLLYWTREELREVAEIGTVHML